ncbi:hypothetical protein G7007_12555 [Pseudomonas entomophila]|uniref:ATP-dependent DNA helicase n=1 Tax=Pseudomonas entomophila TaxID=312306 RepID=UPI0015E3DF15|nr:ATP-dependent RecD-like DNA helicase [Pseudomonas entomophila]MBA1193684.1 hypothetical protein [Pseudomonas entomophila]
MIPQTKLTTVKRQAAHSNIPRAAASVREGQWPTFSDTAVGEAAFIKCEDDEILPIIAELYLQSGTETQILSATKHCSFAGTHAINRMLRGRCGNAQSRVAAPANWSGEELCVGDRVMYIRNEWSRNLHNGSLGVVTSVSGCRMGEEPGTDLNRQALGAVAFENRDIELFAPDLDLLDYAYAITIHKTQGSQFPRVLVALRRSRALDRTLSEMLMSSSEDGSST